jgi:hypothetical protein
MHGNSRLFIAVSAALMIAACSNDSAPAAADTAAAAPAPASAEPAAAPAPAQEGAPVEFAMAMPALPEFVLTPMPADSLPPSLIGGASVTLSLRDGVMWFSAASAGHNNPPGQVLAATDPPPPIVRTEGGDLDLTGFPPGNVQLTVNIDDSVVAGGYLMPADPWQAVALAVDPPGEPAATPVFSQANWPANFQPPTVAADRRSVTWIDTESDQNVYEYAFALEGPNGRLVIDPKIKPGGSTTR